MTLRRANIARIDGRSFDVLVVGGGINGAVSAAALAGRGATVALIDRGDFAGFTSQESSTWCGAGSSTSRTTSSRWCASLCRRRNRLMQAYPDNIKEIAFLAALDRASPYPPWFAALGATAYWGIGSCPHPAARAARAEKIERRSRSSTPPRPRRHRVPRRLPQRQRRPLRVRLRPLRPRRRRRRRQLRRTRRRRAGRRPLVGDAARRRLRRRRSHARPRSSSTPPARSSTGSTPPGACAPITASSTPRASTSSSPASRRPHERVLAFFDDTQRLFYVIPMGHALGHRHHRHPRRHPGHPRDRRGPRLPARPDQRPPRPAPAAHRRRRHRRALRRAPARRESEGGDEQDVEWTSLSRKHEIETRHRRPGDHRVRRQAHRLPQRRRRGRRRRGIARPPARTRPGNWYGEPAPTPAASSTARPG